MQTQLTALALLLVIASAAPAADLNGEGQQRENRRPPRVAVEACAAAVQGDYCSFEGREGELVEGSCEAPGDRPLACRPAKPPRDDFAERQ